MGAVRHLGWDETECPPLPPTGGDGTPAQLARAHRTVPPEAADYHAAVSVKPLEYPGGACLTAVMLAARQLPDLAVGLGRRDDAGIGHTARPLPIAVADSPIEAASPDPQQPMCFLE